jgi:hypothetical protein
LRNHSIGMNTTKKITFTMIQTSTISEKTRTINPMQHGHFHTVLDRPHSINDGLGKIKGQNHLKWQSGKSQNLFLGDSDPLFILHFHTVLDRPHSINDGLGKIKGQNHLKWQWGKGQNLFLGDSDPLFILPSQSSTARNIVSLPSKHTVRIFVTLTNFT